MKGQEVINHIIYAEMPDMDNVREKCIGQSAPQKKSSNRLFIKSLATAATAAVLVFVFLFLESGNPKTQNSFSIRTHAIEQQLHEMHDSLTLSEGSVAEVTIFQDTGSTESTFAHINIYQSIHIVVEGDNLEQVEFFIDGEGEFKKVQYLTADGVFVDSAHGLTVINEVLLGNSFTLDDLDSLSESNSVILAGRSGLTEDSAYITIRAVATFHDSTTQEERLSIIRHLP